ncbi:FecR family protein [Pedobacter africanus]|uniref:FecR family protein n=1 Tax=Pedobacter africanus TaxID=151894 RepID=A0A1W1Z748_9SPHI|nr:FecR domain-containing protein [Pedobacter africanus]SMC44214.1 FecR family protein [Pedobacter africanus]
MNRIELEELLNRYRKGECSAAELELLEAQIFYAGNKPLLSEQELAQVKAELEANLAPLSEAGAPVKKARLWPHYIGAAAAVAAIAFGIWFYTSRNPDTSLSSRANAKDLNDIAPGGNHATLTSNGKTISLSDAKTGITITDKELAYNDGTKINALNTAGEQTLVTPRGGTYQVTLPDGTHVWLNAASSLTYSAALKERGAVRRVKLSGEAYFEVAKDKTRPFVVETAGQSLEVLGTHFNVNAYTDESGIRTTLLEGSVRVTPVLSSRADAKDLNAITLKPGQQSLVTGSAGIKVKEVDVELAVAWKNGLFTYSNTTMDEVMRQVARWYNVTVAYQEPELKNKKLSGSVTRYDNLSALLKALEYTAGVKFKIEGQQVVVSK